MFSILLYWRKIALYSYEKACSANQKTTSSANRTAVLILFAEHYWLRTKLVKIPAIPKPKVRRIPIGLVCDSPNFFSTSSANRSEGMVFICRTLLAQNKAGQNPKLATIPLDASTLFSFAMLSFTPLDMP